MAQMITLEEAAEKLGLTPEEMKKRLKTDPEFKRLSQIRDGAAVRFKLSAIEELGRQLGQASDEGLPMKAVEDETPGSDEFKVEAPEKKKGKKQDDSPLEFTDSSEEDVFSLADEPSSSSSPKSTSKIGYNKPAPNTSKNMSDSSSAMEGSSDSDVRLDGTNPKAKQDEAGVPTEEISLDFSGPGSAVIKGGSSAKLSAPKSGGSSGKLTASDSGKNKSAPPPPDSSEFELSLDADSDDFEMQMNTDGGDEVDLGTMPKEKGASPSSGRSSKSGINLRDPADDGIVLDQGSKSEGDKSDSSDSEPDFELSLDSSSAVSSTKLGAPKSGKLVLDADSDSEFELTLDDSGGSSIEHAALDSAADDPADKGDIFETDFEIPPMPDESASEAVALESDTDLEKSDFVTDESDVLVEEGSESEVVLLGDEDEAPSSTKSLPRAKARAKPAADTESADVEVDVADDSEEGSVSKVLKGVKGRKRRGDEDEDEEEAVSPAATIVERPTKPWGILPILFLAPAFIVVFLGVLVGFESLNTMFGYHQPRKPAAPIVRGLASNFDMELKDQ